MPTPAPHQFAQNLHECNSRLSAWLNQLMAADCANQPSHGPAHPATPQQMSGLLSELMLAGGWLRSMPDEKVPELERELAEYRSNVKRLRGLMPSIHAALLHERARLEMERGRMGAAAEWARRSQQTF